MKGLVFFAMLLAIALVIWVTYEKDGFQDLQLPSAYDDRTPLGASPSLNIPVTRPPQRSFTQNAVQPFAPPSTALLAPPPGQIASVNTRPAEDPALQKASPRRIQSVFESMNGFFERSEAGLQKLGDPSVQLPLTTARSDKNRLKDELAVLLRNPGLESSLTEEDLSGIEGNLAYLQRKWNMSVNAESGMPPEGFQNNSRWSIFGWLFGEKEGFQTAQYKCPLSSPNKGSYILSGTKCIEQCREGYTKTAITCKNMTTNDEYLFSPNIDATLIEPTEQTATTTVPMAAPAPASPIDAGSRGASVSETPATGTERVTYKCPTTVTPQGGTYYLSGNECIEKCPEGYTRTSIACKNPITNAEYIFNIIPATLVPNTTANETVTATAMAAPAPATNYSAVANIPSQPLPPPATATATGTATGTGTGTGTGTYKCPITLTPQGGMYYLAHFESGAVCIEKCHSGYIQNSKITCKNTTTNAEYNFSIIPATWVPANEMEAATATAPAPGTAPATATAPAPAPATAAATAAATATTATSSSASQVTLTDLKDLSSKLQYEILRLESSGST